MATSKRGLEGGLRFRNPAENWKGLALGLERGREEGQPLLSKHPFASLKKVLS